MATVLLGRKFTNKVLNKEVVYQSSKHKMNNIKFALQESIKCYDLDAIIKIAQEGKADWLPTVEPETIEDNTDTGDEDGSNENDGESSEGTGTEQGTEGSSDGDTDGEPEAAEADNEGLPESEPAAEEDVQTEEALDEQWAEVTPKEKRTKVKGRPTKRN